MNRERGLTNAGAQQVRNVDGPALNTIESVNDLQGVPIAPAVMRAIVAIRVAATRAIIPIPAALVAEHGSVDKTAFVEVKLPLFSVKIAGEYAERLVFSDGGIASHGLVVDGHAAIHAAAGKKIAEEIGHIGSLLSPAIVSTKHLPGVLLRGHTRGKNSYHTDAKQQNSDSSNRKFLFFHGNRQTSGVRRNQQARWPFSLNYSTTVHLQQKGPARVPKTALLL